MFDVCEISVSNADECFYAIAKVLKKETRNVKHLIAVGVVDTTGSNIAEKMLSWCN